ncbi:MAG TPA: SUMF1/EgtB/PvdO family nonheme iron enzyme [Kofleriaceae bacterium]|jgi:formylglycine-generating enzyme required for sulfatase activity
MKRLLLVTLAACGSATPSPKTLDTSNGQLSLAADARMIAIPAGKFVSGSTPEERFQAYDDYRLTSGSDAAREHKWFDVELDRTQVDIPAYSIDLMPVTQAQYAEFVATGRAIAPSITEAAWKAEHFQQDYATEVERFNWKDGRPPLGREDHPVVLVTWVEAAAYCKWRGDLAGSPRHLPSANEYEKAARGNEGIFYPWGNVFDPKKLNCGVGGPNDTEPVGSHLDGASPYGMLDAAGNVFQWTSTPFPGDKMTVKGSAWEDFGGVGRGASLHGRARTARHVIVGFRCAADAPRADD